MKMGITTGRRLRHLRRRLETMSCTVTRTVPTSEPSVKFSSSTALLTFSLAVQAVPATRIYTLCRTGTGTV